MKNDRTGKILYLSIIGYFVMSASILLMPLGFDYSGKIRPAMYVFGILFWLGLLTGIAGMIAFSRSVRKTYKADRKVRRRPGIITFMSNRIAFIFDAIFALSAVMVIVSLFTRNLLGYFNYIILCVFVFSLCMHCIFNGKHYYTYKLGNRRSGEK